MGQVAYARNIEYRDGRADGLSAILVTNGKLSFVVAKDKCLDIIELNYKGKNIHFLSKSGLQGLGHYDTGVDASRSMMSGLFFTCGLSNVRPAEEDRAMHGRIRSTPSENVSVRCFFRDSGYVIQIKGEKRQSRLFGENLVLYRTIETIYGKWRLCSWFRTR